MGPPENPTGHREKQEAGRRKGPVRRPRARRCLLKGCEQRFHPRHARQRYCSEPCRAAAREWAEWKAQQTYRATAAGKRKRNGQSQRYRQRVKQRKPRQKEVVAEAARVIPKKFFRGLLRPARLLRVLHAFAAIAAAALLFACLPACHGTGVGARAALAISIYRAPPLFRRAAPPAGAMNARRTPR